MDGESSLLLVVALVVITSCSGLISLLLCYSMSHTPILRIRSTVSLCSRLAPSPLFLRVCRSCAVRVMHFVNNVVSSGSLGFLATFRTSGTASLLSGTGWETPQEDTPPPPSPPPPSPSSCSSLWAVEHSSLL